MSSKSIRKLKIMKTSRHKNGNLYCLECDGCYALVGEAVAELRIMRNNITVYIDELQENDNNTELGSFSSRLDSTLVNLELLINFVRLLRITLYIKDC